MGNCIFYFSKAKDKITNLEVNQTYNIDDIRRNNIKIENNKKDIVMLRKQVTKIPIILNQQKKYSYTIR